MAAEFSQTQQLFFQYICCFLPMQQFPEATMAVVELLSDLGFQDFGEQLGALWERPGSRVARAIQLAQ